MRADVQKIFKKTPCDKQVMMFTATLPEDTKVVCKKFMRKPVEIIVKEENKEHLEKLQQFYVINQTTLIMHTNTNKLLVIINNFFL